MTRRDFLALAAAGTAWIVANEANGQGMALASAVGGTGGTDATLPGWLSPDNFNAAKKRAAEIVSKLTLKEKISQLGCVVPPVDSVGLPAFAYYGSEALHGLIHSGPVTSFPLPLALGCTWNRSLIHRVFTVVSDEVWAWHKKSGMDLTMYSPPTVNMGARDPRWGRIGENYSEDPYLVGELAVATIHGMQGNDARFLKTTACAKHFIANDTDSDRHVTSASVDPRSFWEYYARGFEACVKRGHVFTVMSSYNELNGIPTSCSVFLLTDVLRRLWEFEGYVTSDCGAIEDICRTHHFTSSLQEAAALGMNAGCDINCGRTYQNYMGKAVDQMLVSESMLDESLTRSFTGRVLLGAFDPPEENPYSKIPISCLESPAHRELALDAARESIVLFKNDGNLLPLDRNKIKKIAVIGPMADVCNLGNYSGTPQNLISPLRGIKEFLGIADAPSYQKRAADFARFDGPLTLESCSEGGQDLSYDSDGTGGDNQVNWVKTDKRVKAWVAYKGVLLAGATEFDARVASSSDVASMEVRLDRLDGPLVCKVKIPNTGDFQKWTDVRAAITPVTGEHTVYLLFLGEPGPLFGIRYFGFTPAKAVASPAQGPVEVTYAMGCSAGGRKDPEEFARAAHIASAADVALVFVGTDEQTSSEGQDRYSISLPGVQGELVGNIFAANPRTILVISSNTPVAVNWAQDNLPAIVGGFFLGQMQGRALAEVLFGVYNPAGRLSTTWYRGTDELPDFHDYNVVDGRTYMYFKGQPLYPFGHGLSYTTFKYDNLRLSNGTVGPGGSITVSLEVTNTGNREGDEIVQLYVHAASEAKLRPMPIKQLVNFERVHLQPGESRSVKFELPYSERALSYWDEQAYGFAVVKGMVGLMAGSSAEDIRLKASFQMG